MARHFFLEHVEEMFGEGAAIDEDGRLTETALTLLRTRYGEENLPDLSDGLDMDQVPALITVRSMADAVLSILATLPEKCPACNAAQWKTDDGTHIVCGACGEAAAFTNGDDLIRSGSGRCRTRPASSRADATEARSPMHGGGHSRRVVVTG